MKTLLTPRSREVLTLLAQGLTILEVGQKLGLAKSTVERHRDIGYQALGIHGIIELIHWAIQHKVIKVIPFPSGSEVSTLPDSMEIKSDRDALARFLPEAWKR